MISFNKRRIIMGIRFTHCGASWSYSGFNRFRTKLAKEIGIDLYKMEGFIELGVVKPFSISWKLVNDPIVPLLNHSDCEGCLTPDECAQVAPRLRDLIQNWPNDIENNIDESYDTHMALKLIEGMYYCSLNNVNLYFI
jgi:hypothetical protein